MVKHYIGHGGEHAEGGGVGERSHVELWSYGERTSYYVVRQFPHKLDQTRSSRRLHRASALRAPPWAFTLQRVCLTNHPRQPGTFGCFFNHQSNHPPSRIEELSDRIEASGPKDAEFRDRSASNVCPIATLRGPIL